MNINYDLNKKGQQLFALIAELYPICRSITGNGVRDTLRILSRYVPLKIHEVTTGTKVHDWTVPQEWNIRDAYVINSKGKKIIDFKNSNLHVLNYSVPVSKKVDLEELKQHLYTLPDHPEAIPYVTSYYRKNWGFCLTHNQYKRLRKGMYEVFIDSTFKNGALTYGEFYIKGRMRDEILFSCYICHPALCNDSLSGVALVTFLAQCMAATKPKYSYRFLFIPETIGSITWLSRNSAKLKNIKGGLVATCLGDPGNFTYKRTRSADTLIDTAVEKVLKDSGKPHTLIDFNPADGSDERQFCSPGINIPIGSLMRTKYGCFKQYHSSADNLKFMKPDSLRESLERFLEVVSILENNRTYENLFPNCEPQLGRRGLYRTLGGQPMRNVEAATFWVLNFSDGKHSLLDISIKANLSFKDILYAARLLEEARCLRSI